MNDLISRHLQRSGWTDGQRITQLEHDADAADARDAGMDARITEEIAALRRSLNVFALSIAGSAVTIAVTVTLAFGK